MRSSSYWKPYLMLAILMVAGLYAAPNLYGEYPALQIAPLMGQKINGHANHLLFKTIEHTLLTAKIPYQAIVTQQQPLLYRFASTDDQLKAKSLLQQQIGDHYLIALNLAPATPAWLRAIGAAPMKLGLDLRGGVHFLLQVDVSSVIAAHFTDRSHQILKALREQAIHYLRGTRQQQQLTLQFDQAAVSERAYRFLTQQYPDFIWSRQQRQVASTTPFIIIGQLPMAILGRLQQETVEQAMQILRNRVNELGISEAIVQQQGVDRIAVDLPGIQETTTAKNILGKTATLAFHMLETAQSRVYQGQSILGTQLLDYHGRPVLLNSQIILQGSAIVSAQAGLDEEANLPQVTVRLSGDNSLFTETTANNIGKSMGVVLIEVSSTSEQVNGKQVIHYHTTRRLISVANITSVLGNNFRITGLASQEEARTLALLLRAGALPTPVTIIEERQIGPSLGQHNIKMGTLSIVVGMSLVMAFMAVYYRMMGMLANIALLANLVLIVAALSLLGATLTLTGMAGIVLTVGMAVDANVLIFERIREEIRRGLNTVTSIQMGYERAFTTILDANMTTLIVMMILFNLGSGIIKGIAITVTIGLITSMVTAISGTRALLTLFYNRNKPLSIGIKQ